LFFGTNFRKGEYMKRVISLLWRARIWSDSHGQDLIEYALMAGFVAVAAGAIMPGVSSSVSKIFSKVGSVMSNAAS
jgi:pilus assembly protein Flp/PilA